MRAPLLRCASALIFGCSSAAFAQDENQASTIDGLVRVVGAQAFIREHCGHFYKLDDTLSQSLSRTAGGVLESTLGKTQAQVAVQQEAERIARDIAEIGVQQWCADQRAVLNTDGIQVFVD